MLFMNDVSTFGYMDGCTHFLFNNFLEPQDVPSPVFRGPLAVKQMRLQC